MIRTWQGDWLIEVERLWKASNVKKEHKPPALHYSTVYTYIILYTQWASTHRQDIHTVSMWWFQGQDCFPTSCRTLSMALATFSSIFWIASCTLRLGDGAPNLHSNPLLIQHRWFCALRLDGLLPFWNKVGRTQNDKGEVRTAHPEVAISDPPGANENVEGLQLGHLQNVSSFKSGRCCTSNWHFGLLSNTRHAIAMAVLFL